MQATAFALVRPISGPRCREELPPGRLAGAACRGYSREASERMFAHKGEEHRPLVTTGDQWELWAVLVLLAAGPNVLRWLGKGLLCASGAVESRPGEGTVRRT